MEESMRKRVTIRSAVVIPDEEPSHRSGKEPMEKGPRIKKSRRHTKDHYERDCEDSESEGFQTS